MSAPRRSREDFWIIVLESGQILLKNYINSWIRSIKFIPQSSLHQIIVLCYSDFKDEHDCWCPGTKSIPISDTKLYIEDGKITTDLYRKPMYVPTSIILTPNSYL